MVLPVLKVNRISEMKNISISHSKALINPVSSTVKDIFIGIVIASYNMNSIPIISQEILDFPSGANTNLFLFILSTITFFVFDHEPIQTLF